MSTLNTCTSNARPATPSAGDALFETDTKKIIVWDGALWLSYDSVAALDDSVIASLSPHMWMDSNYESAFFTDSGKGTAVTADGDRIGCWADRSGNSFDWLQSSLNTKPNLVKNLGKNNSTGALFGSDNLIFTGTAGSEIDSKDMTFVWAARFGFIGSQIFWNETNSNTRLRFVADGDNFNFQLLPFGAGANYSGGTPTFSTSTNAAFGRDINLIAIRTNSSANTTKVYLNGGAAIGSSAAPGAAGKFLEEGHVINMMNGATEAPYWVFDLIVFDSAISDANLNTVYSYLGKKHGVAVTAVS